MPVVEVEIEKLKRGSNPRKDLGDLSELEASVRSYGIIEPPVCDTQYNVLAGFRRLAVADKIGLKRITVVIRDANPGEKFAISMSENLHRKDLNPLEEGEAYNEYLQKLTNRGGEGHYLDTLAKAIGKTPAYIMRRISLVKLAPEVKRALEQGKIQFGHAVLLASVEQSRQAKDLKEIEKESLSVKNYGEFLNDRWAQASYSIKDAVFDTSKPCDKSCPTCHGAPFFTAQQTLLMENGVNVERRMAAGCFIRRTNEWVEQEKKNLQEKKITVLSKSQQEQAQKDRYDSHAKIRTIDTYDDEYKESLKRLPKEPEVFAVGFNIERGRVERKLYCIKPSMLHRNAKAEPENEEEHEKTLNLTRKERLIKRVSEYKTSLLIRTTEKLAANGTHDSTRYVKALAVYELLEKAGWDKMGEVSDIMKEEKITGITDSHGVANEKSLGQLAALTDHQLDRLTTRISSLWFASMENKELALISELFGFNMKKHFVLEETYLNMYTTDQLRKLADELGIKQEGWAFKDECVKGIMKGWKPGKVPKAME